jgi:hypothetical protein
MEELDREIDVTFSGLSCLLLEEHEFIVMEQDRMALPS